jgi:D-alanyl-D-alanine carboxypeptidase
MASNGNLPPSQLKVVPPGRLENNAAAAWNAGPGRAGCKLLGPNSGYRSYAMQVHYWNLYQSGQGNLAARPGTSNHGWGRAVDLAEPWMRTWINNHGARYGWKKVEAPSEWWHVNYVGGYKPPPNPLRFLKGKTRRRANKLLYHRRRANEEATTGKGPKYRQQVKYRDHYRELVEKDYKRAHGRQARVLKRVLKDRDGHL